MEAAELVALGLTEEQASQVVELHNTEVGNSYIPKHRFDEVNSKMKTAQEQLEGRDTEIENLKKTLSDDSSQEEIQKLQKQLADKDKETQLKLSTERKKLAIVNAIAGKVHDNDLVVNMLDLDSIKVEDGEVSGLDEQLESIKSNKAFLFKTDPVPAVTTPSAPNSPNVTKTPPPTGNGDTKTDDDKLVASIAEKMAKKAKLNSSKGE